MNSQSETGSKAVRSVGDSSDRIAALAIGHAAYDLCMVVDAYPPENSKAQTELLIESGGGPAAKMFAERLGFSRAMGNQFHANSNAAKTHRPGSPSEKCSYPRAPNG